MNKHLIYLFFCSLFLLILLASCSQSNTSDDYALTIKKTGTISNKMKSTQEITLNVEDELGHKYVQYVFNGFINADTLSFEHLDGSRTVKSYHPAKKGYMFDFKELGNAKAEIIDFNRDKGTVTLKVETFKQE